MQTDLTSEILELVRFTSTNLPPDVEKKLRAAVEQEDPGSAAQSTLNTIVTNVELARDNSTPICQDTGTPIFYVHYPEGWSTRKLKAQIQDAVIQATEKAYLRPKFCGLPHWQETRGIILAMTITQRSTSKKWMRINPW